MAINLTARSRDTHLIAKGRGLLGVGGSLLLSGVPGSGFVLLSDGSQIILSEEVGIARLTLTAKRRDTNLIAEKKNG